MNRSKAVLALVLLVPVPSLGALAGMVFFPKTTLGAVIFAASKIWLFGLPVVWRIWVDRQPLSLSPPRRGGFVTGVVSGLLISAAILGAFALGGTALIDRPFLIGKMDAIGLNSLPVYLGCAAYWILVNSVLEEYVWRWFVVEQCTILFKPPLAIACAALFFTLHHVFALQVYCGLPAVIACSAGVFIGGLVWSWMYIRYRSIWPGYLSHALADLCIFGIGAWLIFRC